MWLSAMILRLGAPHERSTNLLRTTTTWHDPSPDITKRPSGAAHYVISRLFESNLSSLLLTSTLSPSIHRIRCRLSYGGVFCCTCCRDCQLADSSSSSVARMNVNERHLDVVLSPVLRRPVT